MRGRRVPAGDSSSGKLREGRGEAEEDENTDGENNSAETLVKRWVE